MDKIKLVKSTTCNYELLNLGIIHNSMFLSEMMHQRLANRFPSLCEAQSLKDCDMIPGEWHDSHKCKLTQSYMNLSYYQQHYYCITDATVIFLCSLFL